MPVQSARREVESTPGSEGRYDATGTPADRRPGDLAEAERELSVASAFGRAIEAAQRIVVNHIDLAKLDLLDTISAVAHSAGPMICGALLVAAGWACLSVAAVLLLENWTQSVAVSAAAIGAINLLGGLLILQSAGGRQQK